MVQACCCGSQGNLDPANEKQEGSLGMLLPPVSVDTSMKEDLTERERMIDCLLSGKCIDKQFGFVSPGCGGGISILPLRSPLSFDIMMSEANIQSGTIWSLLQRPRTGVHSAFALSQGSFESLTLEGYIDATTLLGADCSVLRTQNDCEAGITVQGGLPKDFWSITIEHNLKLLDAWHVRGSVPKIHHASRISIPVAKGHNLLRIRTSHPSKEQQGRDIKLELVRKQKSSKTFGNAHKSTQDRLLFDDGTDADDDRRQSAAALNSQSSTFTIPEFSLSLFSKEKNSRNSLKWLQRWNASVRTNLRITPGVCSFDGRWRQSDGLFQLGLGAAVTRTGQCKGIELHSIDARLSMRAPKNSLSPKNAGLLQFRAVRERSGGRESVGVGDLWSRSVCLRRKVKGGIQAELAMQWSPRIRVGRGRRPTAQCPEIDVRGESVGAPEETKHQSHAQHAMPTVQFEIKIPL